ncbi:MAG TPA: hypothetical protein VFA94_08530 [Acidimicrobiales bacterium]|nr:hypothetical protein [Acidimicrobiales bacterium]
MRVVDRAKRDEEGAVLVIVLVVVLVIGLLVSATLTMGNASISNTLVVRAQQAKVYAADAGVEYAMSALKRDNTICPEAGSSADLPTQVFNGQAVTVHCTTLSGSANGVAGYAVIVLDPTDQSLTTQGGGTKSIEGPLWAARLPGSVDVTMKSGDVYEHSGRCTLPQSDAQQPNSLVFNPAVGFDWHCVGTPAPVVAHTLPAAVPPAAPAPTTVGSCKVFYPGTYTTPIALAGETYFVSGVYYLVNTSLSAGSENVVGGMPGPDMPINPAACTNDAAAGAGSGTGVKFILGGTSTISAGNPHGAIELFSRRGGDPAVEGTQRISVMTVPAGSPAPWVASTLGVTDAALQVGNGNNPALVVHGMVHVPNAFIDFSATNSSEAQLRGGLVAARLKLQNSASASGLVVSVDTGANQRQIVVTSTAHGTGSGERDIVATAVIDIASNPSRDVAVESWNTT